MVKINNVIQVEIKDDEHTVKLIEECKKRGLPTTFNAIESLKQARETPYFRYSKYFKHFSAWCYEPNYPIVSEEEFIKFLDY